MPGSRKQVGVQQLGKHLDRVHKPRARTCEVGVAIRRHHAAGAHRRQQGPFDPAPEPLQFRAGPPRSNPQGIATITSGSASARAVQSRRRDGSPARPQTGRPPASSTSSGIQWPVPISGSSHSRQATRGRCSTRATCCSTFTRRVFNPWITSRPSSGSPNARATRRRSSHRSGNRPGHSATIRGRARPCRHHRLHLGEIHGTDGTLGLGQNQVRLQGSDPPGIQSKQRPRRLPGPEHRLVDRRSERLDGYGRGGNGRERPDGFRMVAGMAAAHEAVGRAQSAGQSAAAGSNERIRCGDSKGSMPKSCVIPATEFTHFPRSNPAHHRASAAAGPNRPPVLISSRVIPAGRRRQRLRPARQEPLRAPPPSERWDCRTARAPAGREHATVRHPHHSWGKALRT